ncbi:tyrosyl-DNA phosphodiesterase domain-containing protein [Dothidotthia symphoricarpi CBS 119687]|uniref:Tyrosyl-DNA phosphodiesterase domain-containing protein n=1 Tax=Dothidotthia symphoricarpi CBS 119687 TaxID=1392245 RepID=A0A6A6A7V6_9PLEO|nr:tyrosyl-DNA phosphodiesterase domain-containing protein [Dothidotthia symphoricarpi CBS 119687]KAF2126897.1 tyrosyl-DNA phosphodiesterase domain-containing protein [Dothidotthia symphoricarpi CBS 119687]
MASSDDDEDLKLALAMSMQPSELTASQTTSAKHAFVDLTSDTEDEDEDLRRALALSVQETEGSTVTNQRAEAVSSPSETSVSKPQGLGGFDRKAMEQERLARLNKRKREPSPDRPSKQISRTPTTGATKTSSSQPTSTKGIVLRYPRGAIKRTFATKYPRTDDITIDELLEAPSVNIAVISSFMWNQEWLESKLNPQYVKQIWVMNVKGRDTQERYIQDMKDAGLPNMELHFPPVDGMIHSAHSKYMLLFGKEKLRIVVPTANMTQIDWGEVGNEWQPGCMENSVFLIDLPRAAHGEVGKREELTPFGQELIYFLEQQKTKKNVIDGVLKFDFSQTGHIAFVHSIGGAHKTETTHPTGLSSLTKAIRDLGLDDVKAIELDYAASSLGAINDTFLQRVSLAARGEQFTTEKKAIPNIRDGIRIYFPTDATVKDSVGGPDCGGIISLTRQYYNAPTFPRECLRDYVSTRKGMLSHNKLLFARGRKNDGRPFAWVYIGSANVSESAWGGQKVLKNGSMGSLNIRNWECGIVMSVPGEKFEGLDLGEGEVPPMSVFEGTVEVPFKCPGDEYEGRQPWFFRPG